MCQRYSTTEHANGNTITKPRLPINPLRPFLNNTPNKWVTPESKKAIMIPGRNDSRKRPVSGTWHRHDRSDAPTNTIAPVNVRNCKVFAAHPVHTKRTVVSTSQERKIAPAPYRPRYIRRPSMEPPPIQRLETGRHKN